MKITIECNSCLDKAVQLHLDKGIAVQAYVKAALAFFNDLLEQEEKNNKMIGYGDKNKFASYNTEVSSSLYLNNQI